MEAIPAKPNKYLLPYFSILILLFLPAISGCQRYTAKFIGIQSIGAVDLQKTIESNSKPLILDMREDRIYRKGHIPGAIRMDMDSIEGYLEMIQIPLQRVIVTVCANGWQSQIAAASIQDHYARLFIGCIMAQRFLEFILRISSISDSGGAGFYHFLLLDA